MQALEEILRSHRIDLQWTTEFPQSSEEEVTGDTKAETSEIPHISFSDLQFGGEVGKGGFGSVYEGHWKSKNMTVAIKRVPGKINRQEVEILNQVDHPSIIQFYGVVDDRPGPAEYYIVAELAEGGSLYDLLHKKHHQPSPEQSIQWATEIAKGMNYLHQKKIMHRDLKSSNVLLSGEGNIKICDFGGAKTIDHTTKQTRIGTYRWMAPEVMKGEPVSLSCDVFSYGMLLYEIFVWKLPFADTKTDPEVITKIVNDEMPIIPESIELYLANLMKLCWSANLEDRPSFDDALEILKERRSTPKLNLEKARIKRQAIAKELLDTEEVYLCHLNVIAVDFQGAVRKFNEQTKTIPVSDVQQMFLNTSVIYSLSQQIVERLRTCMDMWSLEEGLGDALQSIAPFIPHMYSTYNTGYGDAVKKLTEWRGKDKTFDTLVRVIEQRSRNGLEVAECMLEPVKRLPKYKMLLSEYLKYMPEDAVDRPATEKTLHIISEVADFIKGKFKELGNANKLLSINRSLQHYDGNLLAPSRVFIKQGILQKVSRKASTPRMFFLFSDILLHTVHSGNDIYMFKNEMPLSGMQVEEPKVSVVPFSFHVHSTTRSLILAANSYQEKQEWMEVSGVPISHGPEGYYNLASGPQGAGGALVLAIGDGRTKGTSLRRSQFPAKSEDTYQEFGIKAPIIVPNKSVSMCQVCCSGFTFTVRRHHCKACGKVVCGNCSLWRVFLPYTLKKERVCHECYELSKQEVGEEWDDAVGLHSPKKPEGVLNLKAYDEQDTLIAGYIFCQDGKTWNRLWCQVKKDFVLYKFQAHEDIKAIQSIPLMGYIVTADCEKNIINLRHNSRQKDLCNVFKIEDTTEFDRWVSVLERAVHLDLPYSYR